jgi:hypothetical protein
MQGQIVRVCDLPSKGMFYPKDIEIYVKPMSVKDEIASNSSRFDLSKANYYQMLLDNITVVGPFNKNNLLYADVQLIDLVRRLYTFDLEEDVQIRDYPCDSPKCSNKVSVGFRLCDIEFTDLEEDCFLKEYEFSDSTKVKVAPITISDFISISRKYLSSIHWKDGESPDVSDFVVANYVASVREVVDRIFENNEKRFEFLFDFFSNLYKNIDKKILSEMESKISSEIVPFEKECPVCGGITEVYVEPSVRFHQD